MSKIKTYKFKLKLNKTQETTFNNWLNACRFVYNLCLSYKKMLYSDHKISITKNDIQKELTDIKRDNTWLNDVHSQTLQDVTDRLFKTYDNFFRNKIGYPKFAKKGYYKSFSFKQGVKVFSNTNKIKLPKLGEVKFFKSQEIIGDIKMVSIIQQRDGWYITLTCELDVKPKEYNENIIGLDMGIKDLVITSDGEIFSNPKTLYNFKKELVLSQRALSRKKKGSNNRKKQIKELQKIHEKISNIRHDYIHKLTSGIINDNQVIICEDLRIVNMLKNHKLSKSISDASWGIILEILRYKSDLYGRTFIRVAPQYTSKDCNVCGYRNDELILEDRSWACPECNTHHDRDVNAAINIKNKGLLKLTELGHNNVICGDIGLVTNLAQESQRL